VADLEEADGRVNLLQGDKFELEAQLQRSNEERLQQSRILTHAQQRLGDQEREARRIQRSLETTKDELQRSIKNQSRLEDRARAQSPLKTLDDAQFAAGRSLRGTVTPLKLSSSLRN
jgi:hypothetical protein